MNKKLLVVGALGLMSVPALAQDIKVFDTGSKCDGDLAALVEGQSIQRITPMGLKSITPENLIEVVVLASDTEAVASYVSDAGYAAQAVTDECVVVSVPVALVKALMGRDDVRYMSASRQFRPLMNNARVETNAEKVVAGEGLETPFTGKGVVIGVIDQGFEYKHPAFTGRVKKYGMASSSGSLSNTAPNRDALDEVGHATHVANIAAGSEVSGGDYHGMAPGADLVLISSDFSSSSVLRQAQAIKKYAEGEGQPWVINMSFGAILGPHDGTTSYDQSMSKLCGEGGLMVAAMGNEGGEKIHAYRTIEDASKPVYLYMKPGTGNTSKVIFSELWSEANDGQENLEITPVLLYKGQLYELTASDLMKGGFRYSTGVDALNNRQYATMSGYLTSLLSSLSIPTNATSVYFMWRVKGPVGAGFHAWLEGVSYPASFAAMASGSYQAKSGDDNYLVGEGGASIPNAVAVASYNNATSFVSENGGSYALQVGAKGGISTFSSRGPQIIDAPKPAVAGPGGVVTSAYSKNAANFSANMAEIVKTVTVSGSKYYYGVMSGTSMACPAVTGIVALWLEANPKLTYDNLIEIFKTTSRRSAQTGAADDNGWNAEAGYGKIDAYEGLKKALELANTSGINETLNTEAPVTLHKGSNAWRVLFNNDESFADIQLYSANGQLVKTNHVDAPRRGSEQVVSLAGLQPGVYLFKVSTTASSMTRKLIVK